MTIPRIAPDRPTSAGPQDGSAEVSEIMLTQSLANSFNATRPSRSAESWTRIFMLAGLDIGFGNSLLESQVQTRDLASPHRVGPTGSNQRRGF
jgi:hypothetical protein